MVSKTFNIPGLFAAPAFLPQERGTPDRLVIGSEDGGLHFMSGEPDAKPTLINHWPGGAFATPCVVDFDGDDLLDIISGNREGKLVLFRNRGASLPDFELVPEVPGLSAIDVGDSSAPAVADLDGDGHLDLVVGNQAGELFLFRGPGFVRDPAAFAGIDVGEMATPALFPGGLVVGRLDGDLLYYAVERTKEGGLHFVEKDSWTFTPDQTAKDIEAWVRPLTTSPRPNPSAGPTTKTLRTRTPTSSLPPPDEFVDEIAFSIAKTPTEVLRATARLGQAGLLLDNAKAIYEMAGHVAYAKVVEKDDRTTLAYCDDDGKWTEADPDIYYWWVVHPPDPSTRSPAASTRHGGTSPRRTAGSPTPSGGSTSPRPTSTRPVRRRCSGAGAS